MLAARFFKLGALYGLIGIALGVYMGASHDHSQMPTHAHLNLLGFVSMMLFGGYYRLHPAANHTMLARMHFWLSNIGLWMMIVGLFVMFSGNMGAEPLTAVGSIVVLISMAMFVAVTLRTKTPTAY
ncbi:hypothetical protein [Gimibacter soli]|uniref:Cytochrome-c oxidase n=1 Tax=Gimibacter soli TaxID=3024400 RepID=A0AAE9XLP5_9PROT|nr:hypothetical protein [Gimibacter soli]WCL53232.1 hypothetical protein PH603_11870 [Gimibacter soli]